MAAEQIPKMMRAVGVRKYCKPEGYEIMEVPVPQIKAPDEVLIRVHVAGIFFADAQLAAGTWKPMFETSFPIILGHQGSGVVVAVGSAVTSLRPGDAVYGVGIKRPMTKYFSDGSNGWAADYAITTADLLLPKPQHLSFEEAAVPLANIITAIQITRATMALNPAAFPGGTLEGKTVLVTAALGASTNVAAQYAKNVLGARELITTASTAKVPLLEQYLGKGTVDRVVDYQTQDLANEVGRNTVDFLYSSQNDVWNYLPLMKRGGAIAAIVAVPESKVMDVMMGKGVVPFWAKWLMDAAQWWYWWKFWGTGVHMGFTSGDLGAREDMEMAGEIIATGKVRGVYTTVALEDLDGIKQGSEQARTRKGKVGTLLVKLV